MEDFYISCRRDVTEIVQFFMHHWIKTLANNNFYFYYYTRISNEQFDNKSVHKQIICLSCAIR